MQNKLSKLSRQGRIVNHQKTLPEPEYSQFGPGKYLKILQKIELPIPTGQAAGSSSNMNDTPASKTLPAFAGQGRRTSMRQPLGQYEFPGSLGYQLFDRLEAEKPRHLLHQVFDTNIKWRRYDSSLGDQPTNQLQETPTKPPYWSLSLQCCTSSAPCNFCPKVERT
ncbi:predicted protein [Histoplasma capsulatum G186AR]|uniref:Uncharacterized protein n=1 Tax=Ajellomyces capsulatus (strain G186AR / H82 / ATCC MYA-2454 / RMSCC 2432) TaxID=447093 RepID=C0NMU3_AJECG|nr:uncharacterized protein HCBG_04070 [Histoplasma capsulatum G186AR]EEH07191.1 predicted protein [Histoplasma capsulatum G186AR]